MFPKYYIKYKIKVCLTYKNHIIKFCKHSGMINTKLKNIHLRVTSVLQFRVVKTYVLNALR